MFVLPNNTNIILAAQQAAELTERNVIVLPTKSVPMGISAALAFDPERSAEENRQAMTEAAESVHTASITFAVRDTVFDDKEIHAGDIMGLIDNKLQVLGHDVREVASELTEMMVADDKSLITIYYGQDVTEDEASELSEAFAKKYDQCDVDLQRGGQLAQMAGSRQAAPATADDDDPPVVGKGRVQQGQQPGRNQEMATIGHW
ncbi:hypothetical protein SDC9_182764 [bioreactor metagenome]|uniref:Fatty acid kinase subunit A-like C-terminal domain-containing protein n=1 Tax=bioreactor metagenome TaxID=1076179 RepID=A0A645H8A4_9ZZZZ